MFRRFFGINISPENCEEQMEKEIKKKTLELFRRDSRNVEILTFDAKFSLLHLYYILSDRLHNNIQQLALTLSILL
jgi:hypothetical protein